MSRAPIGTYTLLFIYVVVFAAFGLMEPTTAKLLHAGAVLPGQVGTGDYWRLVAAAFAHVGIIHLLFNAYFLYAIGPMLERELGLERFLVLYVVAGIGGNVAVCLLYPAWLPAAGGSTSLFGFMGALVALILRRGRSYRDFFDHAAGRSVLAMIVANLVIGWLYPFISNTGHIGGLIAGFGVAFCWFRAPDAGGRPLSPPLALRAASLASFVALTFLACVPFTRTWYQARALWLAPPERAEALREVLVTRGVDAASLDMIERLRAFRDGPTTNADRTAFTIHWNHNQGTIEATFLSLGLDTRQLQPFFDAINKRKERVADYLPVDPWRRSADPGR